jgi:Mrp family chromosome partitioning ATPase
LLSTSRLTELLDEARRRYDRVVIDSPPITAVSDPLLLLPHVEGVIFVVHFGKIRREIVARAVRKLRDSGATLVGAVMNNISIEKHGYHYYPYRYSHYYRQGKSQESAELSRP